MRALPAPNRKHRPAVPFGSNLMWCCYEMLVLVSVLNARFDEQIGIKNGAAAGAWEKGEVYEQKSYKYLD